MEFDFTGQRALVTGGAIGVGRRAALQLAELGAKVYAQGNIQADLDSLKAENPDIETVCVDLLEFTKVREAVNKTTPIHLLVNCGGVIAKNSLVDSPTEEFDLVFGVNVKALVNVTKVVVKDLMERNEKGNIVNVTSITGLRGFPNYSTYSASRSAVNSYTKTIAVELATKGIRVNAVCPTVVPSTALGKIVSEDTGLQIISRTPQGTYAEVQDVVNAVVFLLSDKSNLTTGHCLPVDGGYHCA